MASYKTHIILSDSLHWKKYFRNNAWYIFKLNSTHCQTMIFHFHEHHLTMWMHDQILICKFHNSRCAREKFKFMCKQARFMPRTSERTSKRNTQFGYNPVPATVNIMQNNTRQEIQAEHFQGNSSESFASHPASIQYTNYRNCCSGYGSSND